MKQGENYFSLRGWFRVPLSCSCLRMKVIKLIWSSSLWPWRSEEEISLYFLLPGGARKTLRWGLAPLRFSSRGHQHGWVIEAMAGCSLFLLAPFHFGSFNIRVWKNALIINNSEGWQYLNYFRMPSVINTTVWKLVFFFSSVIYLKSDMLSAYLDRWNPTLKYTWLVSNPKPTGKSGRSPGEFGEPSVQGLNAQFCE